MTPEELDQLAASCGTTGDYAPFDAAMAAALADAPDAGTVWTLCSLEAMSGLAFGDGQLPAPCLGAIVERALSLGDAEMLGAAVRLAAYDPAALLSDEDWKAGVQADLRTHAEALRSAWDGAAELLRTQIAHALAVAGAATPEDVARIDALRRATSRSDVLALVVAVLARLTDDRATCLSLLRDHVSHEDPSVRLFAAASLARLDETLDAAAGKAVTDALGDAPALPKWWGLRTFETYEAAAELAKRVLHRARLEDPTEAVAKLAARSDMGWREAESLQNLAWPDGSDPLGLVAAELTAAQRLALEAYARPPLSNEPGALHPYGLVRPEDVAPFLEQTGPRWSVRSVRLPDGREVRWSAARIWKARVWDAVGHDDAVQALTEPLAAADLFELTCTEGRGILLQRQGAQRGEEHHARDLALTVASLRAVRRSDFDFASAVQAKLSRGPINALVPVTLAALMALEVQALELSDDTWTLLAKAVERSKGHPLVEEVYRATSETARARIEPLRR